MDTKTFALVATLVLIFVTAGCGDGDSSSQRSTNDGDFFHDDDNADDDPYGDDDWPIADDSSGDDTTDDVDDDLDDTSDDDTDDDVADDDGDDDVGLVIEESGGPWECTGERTPCGCVEGYERFVEQTKDKGLLTNQPLTREQIDQFALVGKDNTPVFRDMVSPGEMYDIVLEGSGLKNLLAGFWSLSLWFRTVAVTDYGDYVEKLIVMRNQHLDEVQAMILVPPGDGPFPAILVAPGHSNDVDGYGDQQFRDKLHGLDFVRAGYAILAISWRDMCGWPHEDYVSRLLLGAGTSMVSVQMLELMMGLKYLEAQAWVQTDRIGLISHSGGNASGNPLVWLEQSRFKAAVSDFNTSYADYSWNADQGVWIQNTFSPIWWPEQLRLPNIQPQAGSVLGLRPYYGYPNWREDVFPFFEEHLK